MKKYLAAAGAVALAISLSACSDDSDDDSATSTAAETSEAAESTESTADAGSTEASGDFPVTVDAENGEVTINQRPERIVSLSPSAWAARSCTRPACGAELFG